MNVKFLAALLAATILLPGASLAKGQSGSAETTMAWQRPRRVLYNFDGDSCLFTKAGGKGPVAITTADVKHLIEEVAFPESQVDTVLVCINAQVMYYPTRAGTMRGTLSTAQEQASWPPTERQRFQNLKAFFDAGVDPYAIILAETKRRGREALLAFRMNDDHGNDFLKTRFWLEHPECRLGKGALDFGHDIVRDYTARLIEEAVRRYDCDGIELDFNRFPTFFKTGSVESNVPSMNSLVERIRKMLDHVGSERGRRLVLGVRVPSNYGRTPPTPASSRSLGCDVAAWARRGWVDFVTVSEFLYTRYDLPLSPWKAAVREVPIYGGIECTEGGKKELYLSAGKYRRAAKNLGEQGADGIYLFNFFTTREYGAESWEPPFEVLRDLTSVDIGRRKQLLVDDLVVAEKSGLNRELGRVQKANDGRPIFTAGWFYGTVLHDEGRFKLWYRKAGNAGYGYAESNDGLAFKTLADVKGINFAGDFTLAVEIDPHETDARHRYKAGYDAPGMAAGLAFSADGIMWTPYNGGRPVTTRAADTYNQIIWDPIAKSYRLFTRTDFGTPGGPGEIRGTRSMTNRDVKSSPANWRLVRSWIFQRQGREEIKRRQIYAMTCWIYEGVYFAFMSVYDHPGDLREGTHTNTSKRHEYDVMNTYLATSRDGDSWDLRWVYEGRSIVPRGPDGAFDKDIILPASTIVTHADKHWLYYAGANERHGNEQVNFDRRHAIGLATLRLDRIISLEAGPKPGWLVTRPFKLKGERLLVNLDTGMGEITVEILDEAGKPLPGYSGLDAAAGRGLDDLRWQPRWKDHPDLKRLSNQVVRLKFTLRNAKLYAFQVQ